MILTILACQQGFAGDSWRELGIVRSPRLFAGVFVVDDVTIYLGLIVQIIGDRRVNLGKRERVVLILDLCGIVTAIK